MCVSGSFTTVNRLSLEELIGVRRIEKDKTVSAFLDQGMLID